MYVETPGTSNSPSIVGIVGLLKSIIQRGSIILKVTKYAFSSTKRADHSRSPNAIPSTLPTSDKS